MMRVGDRDGQRIGGIRAGDLHSGKQALDHGMHLGFLGIADADNRLLHEARGIFADVDPGARRDHEDDAPSLAELQRRLGVLVDEHFLDRRGLRRIIGEHRVELGSEMRKPLGQAFGRISLQLAVGDMREAIAFGPDQAPAGRSKAWVKAEDDQASLSKSASLIS